MIFKYAGLSLLQINELDYIDYLVLRRDAFITQLSKTEKGKEYLDNAYRLEETKPNREKLRAKLGRKEGTN